MTRVRCEQITKRFGDTVALDAISLDVAPGELFFLLGPSGCGKSTLLRLIAGLLAPTSGRIRFDDRDVTALGTEQRNAVMCFQSYALWPHLTVRENVRFGLDVRGLGRAEQRERVDEVLRLVQMSAYAARKPNELSGGQQQRVALARALVVTPDCLLLDEPLSNLDARLRLEMRGEIRRICKDTGVTTIYVTHEQKEALSIADRVAILDRGRIEQIGAPRDVYLRPASRFVAGFIGETNLLAARVVRRDGDQRRAEHAARHPHQHRAARGATGRRGRGHAVHPSRECRARRARRRRQHLHRRLPRQRLSRRDRPAPDRRRARGISASLAVPRLAEPLERDVPSRRRHRAPGGRWRASSDDTP